MKAKGLIGALLAATVAIALWSAAGRPSEEALVAAGETDSPTAIMREEPKEWLQPSADGGLALAAENDALRLYFDNASGGVAVEDKATGSLFRSNPENALDDPKASAALKDELLSQIKLVYNVKGREGDLEMTSYAHAMKAGQISWGKLEQGLAVHMVLGREEQRRLLPEQITKESFERDILVAIESDREQKRLLAFYILNDDIYMLKTSITDRDKRVLEDAVKQAGYTFEMLEEEYERIGYSGGDAVFPYFKLTIDYVLKDGGLAVTVRNSEIEYDKDRFQLVRMSVLSYFGAGETGEEGYLFLPDGSGTIIGFNNDGSKNTLYTTGKLYGPDYAMSQAPRGSFKQEFRAPVYGVKRNGAALFAVVEEGDAVAEISGMMGDINHSWNSAFASFTIRNKDLFIEQNAFEQAPWIIYERNEYAGDIALRYFFLTGDDADYSGMANAYRHYLVGEGILAKADTEQNVPFYLDTMGSVETTVRKLGIPVKSQAVNTSFEQAGIMLERLSELGVRNIKLRYKGWYNGGMNATAPYQLKTEKALGGKSGLKRLSELADSIDAAVYPDVDFVTVADNKAFDGFRPFRDGVRSLFQKVSYKGVLNPASLEYEDSVWAVNPGKIPDYYDRFSKAYDAFGLETISLSTIGETLNSNFKQGSQVNRQQSQAISESVLALAKEAYGDVLSDSGNAYTFPYARHILSLPHEDSSFAIADAEVPFLQMALHGYISYASEPLNMANDLRPAVLKALEYGSGVYFKLNYNDASLLKDAGLFDEVHASAYADWEQRAADIYAEVNAVLKDLQSEAIVKHERLAPELFRTTYESGKSIIVNYGEQEMTVEGTVIGPLDYAVVSP